MNKRTDKIFKDFKELLEHYGVKKDAYEKLQGGTDKMEIKSRYEVVAELEDKKRRLIVERDGFEERIKTQERELRDLKREVEDKVEEIKDFKDSIKQRKETIKELIDSVDKSLDRLSKLKTK